ncbi:Uncharacterised protein [Citrobacter amalonaticus]|nr:Uncharacterised protein [Citrobacter amalonaticus]
MIAQQFDNIIVALVFTNRLINSPYVFIRAFKQLKKMCAVKQQNACHVSTPICKVSGGDHTFERLHRDVITEMTAVDNGSEHDFPALRNDV